MDDFLFSLETSPLYDLGRFVFSVILYMLILSAVFFFIHGGKYYRRLNQEARRREERMKLLMAKEPIQYVGPTNTAEEVLRIKNQASHVMETGPYSVKEEGDYRQAGLSDFLDTFVEKQPKEPYPFDDEDDADAYVEESDIRQDVHRNKKDKND